jgi:nitrous oxide reductase accessory protein NosL
MSAFKQLVIQSLFNSQDLQEEIMSFAFHDQKEKSRSIKNTMIHDMNRNLKYHRGPGGYWILAYRAYTRNSKEIGGQICGLCGHYYASHNEDELMDCVKCKCFDLDDDE